ncbi:hypothetical protein GCM10023311_09980 [Flaviramulus aquimarinus]|uniref:HTH araC/xylS-type domain-containing protein n=2 Tax=Flaviramulus aquimarinus TaxID=1170456 RepID=A0ABP9EW90_9FLAO
MINKNEIVFISIIFIVIAFVIMLTVLLRPEIYRGLGVIAPIQLSKRKAKSQALSDIHKRDLFKKLEQHIVAKSPYLNPKLTLRDLAEALKTNANYLSQSINGISEKSFFDYINKYRVEHAKLLLSQPKLITNYTIESIAYESGFNSKSSFYVAFNKFCGMRPSEYLKTIHSSS